MVERKFRQVNREHNRFKKSYGEVLQSDWQDILFYHTNSKDPDKYERLNGMLDRFRSKLSKQRGD